MQQQNLDSAPHRLIPYFVVGGAVRGRRAVAAKTDSSSLFYCSSTDGLVVGGVGWWEWVSKLSVYECICTLVLYVHMSVVHVFYVCCSCILCHVVLSYGSLLKMRCCISSGFPFNKNLKSDIWMGLNTPFWRSPQFRVSVYLRAGMN